MMSKNKRAPEEVENHSEDPIAMMMEMRKELETLKRKNAEEINAPRAENDHMRQSLDNSVTILIVRDENRDPT